LGDRLSAQDGDVLGEDEARELELTVFGLFVFLMARWSTARRDRGPAGAVVGVMARAQAVTAHRGSRRSAWRSSSWGEEPSIGELVE